MAHQIAVAEPTMPVFREGRVVGYIVIPAQPAEPAIGQVEVDFLAQPSFRANAVAISDEQHTDEQLGIDRWPTRRTVERSQAHPQIAEIDEAGDRPQRTFR